MDRETALALLRALGEAGIPARRGGETEADTEARGTARAAAPDGGRDFPAPPAGETARPRETAGPEETAPARRVRREAGTEASVPAGDGFPAEERENAAPPAGEADMAAISRFFERDARRYG